MTYIGSHISLFSGVGMTDIAAEAYGYETIATAEVDPFCRRILRQRFPNARHYEDVRQVQASPNGTDEAASGGRIQRPLLMSGGFPCQDLSGLRNGDGLKGARSGLWSEFARCIGEFQPDYVLIENVSRLRTSGLDRVLIDLCRLGYVARWDGIPAAYVGAPHLRDRLFIVAWKSSGPSGAGRDATWSVGTHFDRIIPTRGARTKIDRFSRAGEMRGRFIRSIPSETSVADSRKSGHPDILGHGRRLLPTPRSAANEWRTTKAAPSHGNTHGSTLAGTLNDLDRMLGRTRAPSSDSAGNINPEYVEWMMGLPLGWSNPSTANNALRAHPLWHREPSIPRTASVPERRARLGALGNGLVPQCAMKALDLIPNLPKR